MLAPLHNAAGREEREKYFLFSVVSKILQTFQAKDSMKNTSVITAVTKSSI